MYCNGTSYWNPIDSDNLLPVLDVRSRCRAVRPDRINDVAAILEHHPQIGICRHDRPTVRERAASDRMVIGERGDPVFGVAEQRTFIVHGFALARKDVGVGEGAIGQLVEIGIFALDCLIQRNRRRSVIDRLGRADEQQRSQDDDRD